MVNSTYTETPIASSAYVGSTDVVHSASGVSWGAIFAGAVGAAALSLILLILGTGLGLSSVSPWANNGVSAATFGISAIIWITFTQLVASGMGGYIAGRLRTKWVGVHTDEVYFRDTAHGFLAWAVATLLTAALLTSSIAAIVGGAAQAGASVVGGAASTAVAAGGAAAAGAAGSGSGTMASPLNPVNYFVDTLFRRDASAMPAASASSPMMGATDSNPNQAGMQGANQANNASSTAEVLRIFATSTRNNGISPEDTRYVGQLVAQRTGLSQADAEKRVTDVYNRMVAKAREAETAARDAADKTRKGTAYASMWLFVSLLIGAFVASLMATFGGRRRDY